MVHRVKLWLTEALLITSGVLVSVQSFPLSPDLESLPRKDLSEDHSRFQSIKSSANHPLDANQPDLVSSQTLRSHYSSILTSSDQQRNPPPTVAMPAFSRFTQKIRGYFDNPTDAAAPGSAPVHAASPDVPTNPEVGNLSSRSYAAVSSQDIFVPVSRDSIPGNIPKRGDHPIKKNNVDANGPVQTNKFYANFFLGDQNAPAYVQPYSVSWSKGSGPLKSYGLAISHVDANQRVFGERSKVIPGNPARYYINPVGIQSLVLSATELGGSTSLTVSNPQAFSANIILRPQHGSGSSISFPLVQGMGFVTGVYDNLQPVIQSGVHFRQINPAGSPKGGVFKYKAILENGVTWLIYAIPENGADPRFEVVSNTLRGPTSFKGVVQVAKSPENTESIYDRHVGSYPTVGYVSGSVSGNKGTYNFVWSKGGKYAGDTPSLMFALPHHVQSFDDASKRRMTGLKLQTTTKGIATACGADYWTMVESNLPVNMGFDPWQSGASGKVSLSEPAKQAIRAVAPSELGQNMRAQTELDSMYFSGKGLGKFAGVVYTVQELLKDPGLASGALNTLKDCFATFVQNRQKYPLVYDTVWKGVVSSGAYTTGDIYLDFGNTAYNDHHFHYGYFILTAAIIGKLDRSWLAANKVYVNMLVRDAGNSVNDDSFPFSRAFDWYSGHSWAKGLFASLDGKDEESTSEDSMFAYAIKMWGNTIGDASMEARGNLMLGILSNSLNNYFLMRNNNANQPKEFVPNKVTGILFENKCDHATYFGMNLEYIQGIHMLPLLPFSAYTRHKEFVKEEWDAMFASNAVKPAGTVEGGWRGVLYSNLALIDPGASWNFFNQPNFNMGWIDGGASRTWYLAYAAGLGGGPR